MPKYRIKALEKLTMETTYAVEAKDEEEAIAKCIRGDAAYEGSEPSVGDGDDDDDEWLHKLPAGTTGKLLWGTFIALEVTVIK